MLRLTVRSYAVSLVCLLSSTANLLLYIRTIAWPILVVFLICLALALLALLSRPPHWGFSQTTE